MTAGSPPGPLREAGHGDGVQEVTVTCQFSHPFATRHLRIEQSAFAEGAGVVGAAWLALENYSSALPPPAPVAGRVRVKGRPVGRPAMHAG